MGETCHGRDLGRDWKSDLEAWLTPFLGALGHETRARMCPAHIAGLIGTGDRKSVQPMAARDGEVGYEQLHHLIASGAWNTPPLEKAPLAAADRLIVDDTALPKKGEHSVGVAPRYGHLDDFVAACNFGRRLKTLKGLTPYAFICKCWTSEPPRFELNPIHQMPGLNSQSRPSRLAANSAFSPMRMSWPTGVRSSCRPPAAAWRSHCRSRSRTSRSDAVPRCAALT